jgi:endo-1,4-beta-D-glucanase Y
MLRRMVCWTLLGACVSCRAASGWPDWDTFAGRFVQADGRVIDLTFERKTTSEGQAYALFFALVANQRPQFDRLLSWTSDNLAAGQLGDRLPAWLWGMRADGSWGVKDRGSASDADLWLAYTLLEAARLWQAPKYADTGRKLLDQIRRHEIVQAGGVGPVLLPGPFGFMLDRGRFRIDPSYLPDFMFRYLAGADPQGPWQAVWDGYLRMAPAAFAAGVAPDEFVVDSNGVVTQDSEATPSGSYDAIRVYLWAGMSGRSSQDLVRMLTAYAVLIRSLGVPPEKVDPRTGIATKSDYSPMGFSGAALPFLSVVNDKPTLQKQLDRLRVDAIRATLGEATNYYDQVLILFGKGWLDGEYRFDDAGRLQPKWAH